MAKNVLTHKLSEPLDGATTAKIDIQAGDGNLIIDCLSAGEQALASGTLQYLEGQGGPTRNLVTSNGHAILTLRGGSSKKPWLRLPWSVCNGATEWQVYLNPAVSSDLTAHSDGGNLKLDLAEMTLTRLAADTGGGNVDVDLPDNVGNLDVTVKSGAGNVTVVIPGGAAARIQATTGLGRVILDPRYSKVDKNTYQSPGFDNAAQKVVITASSGAGNVSVSVK